MTTVVGVNLLWMVAGEVGGTEAYLTRLLAALADRPAAIDYRLFVLPGFAAAHPDLAARFETETAPIAGHRRTVRVAAESTWLAGRLRRTGVDVVHHAGGTVPPTPQPPILLTVHDIQYLTFPEFFSPTKRRYLAAMVPRSVRRAAVVMVATEFVKATLVDRFGTDPDRVVVVPIPAQLALPAATPAAEVRRRYGLGDRPFFLYPAITYPHKNHAVLVEALAQLVDGHPEALLVLTGGTASAEPVIEAEIFRRNLTAHVRRPGRVPAADLEALFAEAAALVFPSRYEGFGAPVIEAMQRRCPVIGADATAVPEVADGAALLVDPDDVEGWAAAMATMLEDPERRRRLIERGVARTDAFAPDRAAATLEEAYGRALR